MKIWRVETPDGGGIYRGNFSASDWYDEGFHNARHPTPSEDALLSEKWDDFRFQHSGIRFGFTSREQMRAWLYKAEWRARLKDLGCRAVIYEVPDGFALAGDTQAVFVRDAAVAVGYEELC